jgi:hypothetical protein
MPAPYRRLSVAEFADLLARFPFTRRVNQVHMHHTWSPSRKEWRGAASVQAMRDFHVRTNGWSDIAQHVTIAPDGGIWTGRNWNQAPASSGGFNGTSAVGPFMFETVGNFDVGRDPFDGPQRDAVLEVIARVQLRFGLPVESLHFHRQLNSPKTCPGSAVGYEATLDAVRAVRKRLASAAPRDLAGRDLITRAPFGDDALAAAELAREFAAARAVGEDPADAEPQEELSPAGFAEQMTGGATAAPAPVPAGATRGGAAKPPALTPAQLQTLRPHVINLAQGQWSTDGAYQTSQADADAIADEHLPAALAAARAEGRPLRVVVFAHGGLVDEASGLGVAHRQTAWWKANGVYPLFFVWETGLAGTVKQLLAEAGRRLPRIGARDLWDRTSDPLVEMAARALGGAKVWGGMKWSAERASAPGGGARHVAERLGAFAAAANAEGAGSVELHAVGHSAGSIFHAHFLPALLAAGAERVDSLHLLAPAARTDLYAQTLLPLVEDGRVARCAMFTMAQDWEKADDCNKVYRKSLLYLVSRAFERERPCPIVGLEESVRADARLRAHFGLAGRPGAAEVVWSRTGQAPATSATTSTSHGGFDDDAPTMESVLRRVLGDVDGTRPIQAFPATRTVAVEEAWPEELAWAAAVAGGDPAGAPAAGPMPAAVDAGTGAVDPFAGATETDLAAQLAHDDAAADAYGADEADADEAAEDADARPLGGAVAPSATTPSRRGRRRALCVGIDTYPAAPLHGCVADARLWQRTLGELGFDDVRLMTDAQATRAALLAALGDLLATSRRGDVVVFQYSGHGTQVPDVDRDEGDANDEALVPVDYASGRFLVDDDLRAVFDRAPAGVAVTCFMDCCHSGTITRVLAGGPPAPRPGDAAAPRARYLDLRSQAPDALAAYVAHRREAPAGSTPDGDRAVGGTAAGSREAMRTVLYSACLSTEVAYEQNGHGDFTRLVTPLLKDAVQRGATHVQFRQRAVAAFGATPRQHPTLDCAPGARSARLLQPVAAPAPRGPGAATEAAPLDAVAAP